MRNNISANNIKQLWRDYIVSPILAGICIAISGIVYIKIGGVVGSILFAFGLITVIHYGFKLYTGTAGFIMTSKDFSRLVFILVLNSIGCILVASMMKYVNPELSVQAIKVVETRLGLTLLQCGLMGVGCGFIMTTVVKYARENKWLPLLFGVPVFILCGFLHSIADIFYIAMIPWDYQVEDNALLYRWYMVVAGNLIGCNLVRILNLSKNS